MFVLRHIFPIGFVLALLTPFSLNAVETDKQQLLEAARLGDRAAVERLIAEGADVNVRNELGLTALTLAAREGHPGVVETLLNLGADLDIRAGTGIYTEIVPEPGAGVEVTQNSNSTVVDFSKPAKVNYGRLYGETALIMAAQKGHAEIVRLLLTKGASIDMQTSDGKTALMKALEKADTEMAKLLLANGADSNVTTMKGTPLLQIAALGDHVDIVDILLARGADANYQEAYYPKSTILILTAEYGHADVIESLLEHGARIDERNEQGNTALILAARKGHAVAVEVLLRHGADPNVQEKFTKRTPLFEAIEKDHTEVAKTLLEYGASPGIKSSTGQTPLQLARGWKRKEIEQLILARQAANGQEPRKNIKIVQSQLNSLGFDAGPADGLMGQKTQTAIRLFQASIATPQTGSITAQLMEQLRDAEKE